MSPMMLCIDLIARPRLPTANGFFCHNSDSVSGSHNIPPGIRDPPALCCQAVRLTYNDNSMVYDLCQPVHFLTYKAGECVSNSLPPYVGGGRIFRKTPAPYATESIPDVHLMFSLGKGRFRAFRVSMDVYDLGRPKTHSGRINGVSRGF